MFKATIPAAAGSRGNAQPVKVFIKRIPVNVWRKQWEGQCQWRGEYVTDGENFVMEAATLAFLQEYAPGIAPRLFGILEQSVSSSIQPSERSKLPANKMLRDNGPRELAYVVIVSELYGEDLLDFLDRREKENKPLSDEEKRLLQYDGLCMLQRLHSLGFAHLDFTPENVLIGSNGLRLCDFAKTTPRLTPAARHLTPAPGTLAGEPFESCEPTVGKGAYMPPECWKVYRQLENTQVQYPLTELSRLERYKDREAFYFKVTEADVYMAGVLMFWIWADGGVWKCSDNSQDEKYKYLVQSQMDFDLFRECRLWPSALKQLLKEALRPSPAHRPSLAELLCFDWFKGLTPVAPPPVPRATRLRPGVLHVNTQSEPHGGCSRPGSKLYESALPVEQAIVVSRPRSNRTYY
eukprot:GHVU01057992.1.p2 GENE.GHVU01057992.1~~GHVU01057992.1.p2  ORF type:complete len:407 (-),score=39.09 GHVU01057992.1:1056-2276(-)